MSMPEGKFYLVFMFVFYFDYMVFSKILGFMVSILSEASFFCYEICTLTILYKTMTCIYMYIYTKILKE